MIKKSLFKIIRFYQIVISPLLGSHCRFRPSCSQYCYLSIEKYGITKGLFLGIKRILRCHPLSQGGVDLP